MDVSVLTTFEKGVQVPANIFNASLSAFPRSHGQEIPRSASLFRFLATAAGYSRFERNLSKYVTVSCHESVFAHAQPVIFVHRLSIPDIAKQHPHAMELNVLVIGMPNVGKSTLLNALRNMGIKGRASLFSPSPNRLDFPAVQYIFIGTPKALKTSAHPGLTQALSTRLKVSLDPLVYAFDTPGVMLPFLGRGQEGAERGVKLALIGT